jgi:hypothetical protein
VGILKKGLYKLKYSLLNLDKSLKSQYHQHLEFLISDEDRPLSTNEVPIAIKTEIIPIRPNSEWTQSLAITIVPIKETPQSRNVSAKVQISQKGLFFLTLF